MIWYFMPGDWLFNEILVWGVMVVYWLLISSLVAWAVLLIIHDRLEDRLEDD